MDPFKNGSCNPSKTLSQDNIYRKYMKGGANKYSVKVMSTILWDRRFVKTKLSTVNIIIIVDCFNYPLLSLMVYMYRFSRGP